MAQKVWFVTGTSRGFGRVWAEAALKRGDKVVATARDPATLEALVEQYGEAVLPLRLDVTERETVFSQFAKGYEHFGRIDVVLNNAGYGLFGAIEENTEQEVRHQMEVNFFGALWVIQAALPYLRKQGGGHILSTSSIGGVLAIPSLGIYNASKWALEAANEALAQEVAPYGIKITLIEPGGYATDWAGSSAVHSEPNAAYDEMRGFLADMFKSVEPGDPDATSEAILKVVDAEKPPLRIVLGNFGLPIIRKTYKERLKTWSEWEAVSVAAQKKPSP
jgi:NAD(P)-dependent dehydrogenase (short-subunit alcohol dehydrogenase family)